MSYYDIKSRAENWLKPVFDEQTQREVKELLDNKPEELKESFYKDLEFGTGGMRGIMGPGTNRINKYTLGKNTQGLSNYLKRQFPNEDIKVVIAYDCRNNSKELAHIVAEVFSANGIQVYLFSELRPTPELSFAVKYLNCHCGIVLRSRLLHFITESTNRFNICRLLRDRFDFFTEMTDMNIDDSRVTDEIVIPNSG